MSSEYIIDMPDDQESTILTEEAPQEKDPEKLLEIILSLAAAINEQQSQGGTQVSTAPAP
jgi:hypothetical protein